MKQHEKLDIVLNYIRNHHSQQYDTVTEFAFEEPVRTDLKLLLAKLVKDGYVLHKERPASDVNPAYNYVEQAYMISAEGVEFTAGSSYKKKYQKRAISKVLEFIKKFGLFINGFLILCATFIGVYFNKRADDRDTENKELKTQIDSLKKVINNQMLNRKDTTRMH